jgi:hypothetical protein
MFAACCTQRKTGSSTLSRSQAKALKGLNAVYFDEFGVSAVRWTHYWLNAHAVPEHDWHVGQDKAHSMHSIATSLFLVVKWQVTVGLAQKSPNRQSHV